MTDDRRRDAEQRRNVHAAAIYDAYDARLREIYLSWLNGTLPDGLDATLQTTLDRCRQAVAHADLAYKQELGE